MNLQLINGEFCPNDAIELITQMIAVKIKYHEDKISLADTEEDIKVREIKIKRLQKELFEVRNVIKIKKEPISINSNLNIE